MAWCEMNRVDFLFGLARNPRLVEEIAVELLQAKDASATGAPARRSATRTSAIRRGLASPTVHSALATTRRRRDQLSSASS